MRVLVIDAQGGGIGKQLVSALKSTGMEIEVTAVGTNTAATLSMLKAGADHAATGENAVLVNSKKADIIAGPIGIVIADSLFGEITPGMANAVAQSNAKRILIPINHCDNIVVGIEDFNMSQLIRETISKICSLS